MSATLRELLTDVWHQQVRHHHCGETPERHVAQFVEAVAQWLDSEVVTEHVRGGDLVEVSTLAREALR